MKYALRRALKHIRATIPVLPLIPGAVLDLLEMFGWWHRPDLKALPPRRPIVDLLPPDTRHEGAD